MPNPKVEFVAILDESEEDEIEVIPFVKPPPLVIDIVESDSESINSTGEKKKRKKKKKKSKKEKEREGSTYDASHGTDPSLSLSVSSQFDINPINAENDEEHNSGQNVESEAITTSSGYSSSSGNVATVSTSIYSPADGAHELPINNAVGQGLSSSNFEANDYTQSVNPEGISVLTDAAMVGTSAQNEDPREKRSRSKEKKIRGEGKPRARKISATQRTNEEIVNFLTTLGIQMEVSAFESPSPAKKRRPKRVKSAVVDGSETDLNLPNATNDGSIIEDQEHQEQATTTEANVTQGGFVSVTQENNNASKNSSPRKAKRQRTAIAGDISDFQVSFSKGELNSINTNFQSNVIFTPSENAPEDPLVRSRLQNYELVIDAVVKSSSGSSVMDPEHGNSEDNSMQPLQLNIPGTTTVLTNAVSNADQDFTSPMLLEPTSVTLSEKTTPALKNTTQFSRKGEEIKAAETVDDGCTDTAKSSTGAKRKHSSKDTTRVRSNLDGDRDSSSKKENKKDQSPQEIVHSTTKKRQKSDCEKNHNTSSTLIPDPNLCSATQPQRLHQESVPTLLKELPQNNVACTEIVPFFPSTWTDHMKEFYGSSQNEGFELDDVWNQLSDAPGKWRALRDTMPPPKNKNRYVRCDNCKQMGHFARACTEKRKVPCCHMCGSEGHTSDHHSRRPCPESKCLNCGRNQVQFSQRCSSCLLRRHPRTCEICNVIGHDKTICPDNWRPFHTVTSIEEYEKAKPTVDSQKCNDNSRRSSSNYYKTSSDYKRKSAMFCSNCGRKGHSYYDCYQSRFNPYHRNKPFVIRDVDVPVASIVNYLGSNSSTIPISYDARTGRTVVLNTEGSERPEIAVETIQVKITNELAVAAKIIPQDEQQQNPPTITTTGEAVQLPVIVEEVVGQSSSTVANTLNESLETAHMESWDWDDSSKKDSLLATCKQHGKCTNSPKANDECRQTILQTQSYLKLVKAQEDGLLKLLEEKHGVEISLINDNNRFHICGEGVAEAQKDVSRILWTKENNCHLAMVFTNETIEIRNAKAARNNAGFQVKAEKNTPQTTTDITMRDAQKNETADQSSGSWKSLKSPGNVMHVVTVEDDDDDDCCVIAELPSGTNKTMEVASTSSAFASLAKAKLENRKELATTTPDTIKETRIPKKSFEQADVVGGSIPNDSSFLRYESPLAGLTLGNHQPTIVTSDNEVHNRSPILYSTEDLQVLNPLGIDSSIDSKPKPCNSSKRADGFPQPTPNNTDTNAPASDIVSAIEIITLDDEEEAAASVVVVSDENEEKVTLLQSEWNLVMSHSVKIDNIINQISSRFDVDLVISKEVSSISILNGTKENRKLAKDNIVFWLECQSSNSEFRILPSGYNQLTGTPNKSKKPNKKSQVPTITLTKSQNKRILKLKDASIAGIVNQLKSKTRKRAKRWKKKSPMKQNSGLLYPPSTTTTTSQAITPGASVGAPIPQWNPGFNPMNFGNTSLPLSSGSLLDLDIRSPRKGNRNNSPHAGKSPRSRFNFQPRKRRYYHNQSI